MSAVDVDEILEHQLNANMLSMPYDVYSELFDSVTDLGAENAKLRELVKSLHALCRDMYLVVELLDLNGTALQAHGKDADWRTLRERYDELRIEVDE